MIKPARYVTLTLSLGIIGLLTVHWMRPAPEQAPAATAQSAIPLPEKKIVFLVSGPQQRAGQALADWFLAETGAVVEVVSVDYNQLLDATLQDHDAAQPRYDVVQFWYPTLGKLIADGAITDLTDFIQQNTAVIQPDDFLANIYDSYTLNQGRRWALPWDGDTQVLYYRLSLLQRYGFAPPATWEEYLTIEHTLTSKLRATGIYGAAIMAEGSPASTARQRLQR